MATPKLRNLWAEIRRRRVPRMAAYYIAGAWVAAQVAALLLDAFDAHDYTRYVIGVLAAGLPVALLLAWRFDLTARGIERTLSIAEPPPPEPLRAVAVPESSIAVLPFANLSQDPDNEYFSDGLSEEIRNQLARCTDLRVVARSSSFAFKGRHEDVREIGRRLGVAKILEGGVRRHAGTVRIDVQLVNAADGYHLWSQTFERRLGDIFSLQSEIATEVMAAVGERRPEPLPTARPPETRNFTAYNAYLLGRHYFHKRTEATLQRAIECFEQAISADPDYALAYSGLADACLLVSAQHYGNVPLAQALERAQPAARRALELEPGLAEAHASRGMVLLHQGELASAEQAFRHALELNPGYTMAHIWLGLAMTALGRYREAADSNLEAFRLDPLSPIVNSNVGFDSLRFGDTTEARTRFRTAMEVDPEFLVPYAGMARLESSLGNLREALRWIEAVIARAPTRAYYHAARGLLLLQLGQTDAAAESIESGRRMGGAAVYDSDLVIAIRIAHGDRETLSRIAADDPAGSYTEVQRAHVQIVLGQLDGARAIYDAHAPDAAKEINTILRADWFWRLPHTINHAHLTLLADAARGRERLEHFLAETERVRGRGLQNAWIQYLAATAHALLGQRDLAFARLEEAIRLGWRHAWWADVDWNAQGMVDEPRWQELLALARVRET
jgi:TolB-like protein/Flp pilus assembly protein TadD